MECARKNLGQVKNLLVPGGLSSRCMNWAMCLWSSTCKGVSGGDGGGVVNCSGENSQGLEDELWVRGVFRSLLLPTLQKEQLCESLSHFFLQSVTLGLYYVRFHMNKEQRSMA